MISCASVPGTAPRLLPGTKSWNRSATGWNRRPPVKLNRTTEAAPDRNRCRKKLSRGREPDILLSAKLLKMKVVIFCGGLGTRLREETEFRPKPMVPVGERPILWHIMKNYAHYGHKEFILCLGYKGEAIKEYFRNYHWNTSDVTLSLGAKPKIKYHNQHDEEDWTVTMVDTGQNTMTGGRLKRVLPYIKDETFL